MKQLMGEVWQKPVDGRGFPSGTALCSPIIMLAYIIEIFLITPLIFQTNNQMDKSLKIRRADLRGREACLCLRDPVPFRGAGVAGNQWVSLFSCFVAQTALWQVE